MQLVHRQEPWNQSSKFIQLFAEWKILSSAPNQIETQGTSPMFPAMAGGILLWSAFPPLGLWPLAFAGLFFWLRLAADPKAFARPKSFRVVWLSSFLFWMATNYFVTLPHWAGFFGWPALSGFLAIYFPFFFASCRAMVHRFGAPILVAAPICWVAMEWLRAHVLTGYGLAMLPHTMYRYPLLIQTADIMGGYGTSFLIVLIAAAAVSAWQSTGKRRIAFACVGLATVSIAFGYGAWRLSYEPPSTKPPIPVALIQGSRDVRFELSPEQSQREWLIQFREYRDLTEQARQRWPDLKLIVWPESAFPQADAIPQPNEHQLTSDKRSQILDMRESAQYCYKIGIGVARMQGDSTNQTLLNDTIPLLTGGHGYDAVHDDEFNSAFLFDRAGQVCFRYHKMHLVMFGEYVPLGDLFPSVYKLMPFSRGLDAGTEPEVFDVDGVRFSPSICFESTVGHLIRRQVQQLKSAGREPDVLVNLTNDGWFYGSNCLDLHLACNVFRAVELRKPMLVAANTGFSAHIDGSGRLLQRGPRRQPVVLRASVVPDSRVSPYFLLGDWPVIGMTILAITACIGRRFNVRRERD